MKLKYNAHACFTLSYKNGTVLVTDPFDETVTYAPCNDRCDIALVSHDHFDHNHTKSLEGHFETIRTAGTFDYGGLRVTTTESFHDKEKGALRGKNLISRIEGENLCICHLGDLGHMPCGHQTEVMEGCDVLLIPIGGTFTIDTDEAEQIIRAIKPHVAIAMHFHTDEYDAPITTEEKFVKDMNAVYMPREIEITSENIASLPPVIVMAHK